MPKRKNKSRKPVNYVRGETHTFELANVGSAINLEIYRDGALGKLLIGQGGLAWVPAGKRRSQKKHVPWEVFSVLMGEWPFGNSKRARLKFVDGALRWRAPRKKGRGKKITWDEFVDLMDWWFENRALPEKGSKPRRLSRRPPKPPKPPGGTAFPLTRVARPVRIDGIPEAMRGIRKVYLRARVRDGIWLTRGGAPGKTAPIRIWSRNKPMGWIDTRGYFHPKSVDRARAKRVARDLREFVKDPKRWALRSGKETGICAVCGRKLTNPESVARGIGPVCAGTLAAGASAGSRKRRPRKPKVPVVPTGAKAVKVEGIRQAMSSIKKVYFKAGRHEGVWLVNTGTPRRPAPIKVMINNSPKGWIDTRGYYHPSSVNRPETKRVVVDLRKLIKDPEHWVKLTGQQHGICAICGHPLRTETSLLRGIGPVCAQNFGLRPHEERVARAA